jgi:outer membrane protein assembly factor BamB
LCLFGSRSGWVSCLRADDGGLVWRLRVAPSEQRIVAFGQIESPWPVPGSVLVVEDTAYFAAGRQPLADGGILVLAVEPATGRVRWMQRLDHVPQTNFYASSGMDFENFDVLHQEGDAVAMSRWLFDRTTGQMSCLETSGFARLGTGDAAVLFPRGSWSYAPPYEPETWQERPFVQPLAVFRGSSLYGSSQDRRTLFRRDFRLAAGEKFDTTWVGQNVFNAKYGRLWRSQLLARDAGWTAVPFPLTEGKQSISALMLAGDSLYAASSRGGVAVVDTRSGELRQRLQTPPAAWDGMAAADGRMFLSTQDGRVVCLGQVAK